MFANEEQMNDPVELTKLIAKHSIDAMNATPSRYMQYLEYKPFAEALAKCSLVMAGGEAFPDVLLKRMREYGIKNIANSYGPTEITVSSNLAVPDDAKHISVGRPLLNYSEYIVDSDMNIVPQGVVGELLIGGAGVAKGYCNLPEQTAERFKLDKVGATDNFFEIGGTSLLVTSVAIDAAEHGFEITYGDIFRRSTPRDLANMFVSDKIDEVVKIVDFVQYDYSKITKLLSHNNMSSLLAGKTRPVGNIMLTGATGFMGIHVLAHFLKHEKGKAYCLLRKGRFDEPLIRLKNVYFYYFKASFRACGA